MIDFEDWINIPRPLVNCLAVFKQCLIEQSQKLVDQREEFEGIVGKLALRLTSANENLAHTNNSLRGIQENVVRKVKESCGLVSNDFDLFRKKMSQENTNRQADISEWIMKVRAQVDVCEKKVEGVIDETCVKVLIEDSCEKLHQRVLNEIREQYIKPIGDKLNNEMLLGVEKQKKNFESHNAQLKVLESRVLGENSKLGIELRNFRLVAEDQFRETEGLMLRLSKEITMMGKQITVIDAALAEREEKSNQSLRQSKEDLDFVNEKLGKLFSKVETLDNYIQQRISKTKISHVHVNNSQLPINDVKDIIEKRENNEVEINRLKEKVELDIKIMKSDLIHAVQEEIRAFEWRFENERKNMERNTLDLKDKLTWLPINVGEIKGMSPSDARLFTLEARLRAEENSRIKAMSFIENSLKKNRRTSESPLHTRSPDVKRATPDLAITLKRSKLRRLNCDT